MTNVIIILTCTAITVFGYYLLRMYRRWRFITYLNAIYAAQGDDFIIPMHWGS